MMTSSDQQQIVTESHQNSEKLYAERIDAVATTAEILVDVLCEEIDLLRRRFLPNLNIRERMGAWRSVLLEDNASLLRYIATKMSWISTERFAIPVDLYSNRDDDNAVVVYTLNDILMISTTYPDEMNASVQMRAVCATPTHYDRLLNMLNEILSESDFDKFVDRPGSPTAPPTDSEHDTMCLARPTEAAIAAARIASLEDALAMIQHQMEQWKKQQAISIIADRERGRATTLLSTCIADTNWPSSSGVVDSFLPMSRAESADTGYEDETTAIPSTSHNNRVRAPPPPPPPAPPPPPPPEMLRAAPLAFASKKTGTLPPVDRSKHQMGMHDVLKDILTVQLRKAPVNRSPNGTPTRQQNSTTSSSNSSCLALLLRDKFKNAIPHSDPDDSNVSCDWSDEVNDHPQLNRHVDKAPPKLVLRLSDVHTQSRLTMNMSIDDGACAVAMPTPATQSAETAELNESAHEHQVAEVVKRLLTLVTQDDV